MWLNTNIVFLYADSVRRDLSTCYVLKKMLEAEGYRVFIFSRRNFTKMMRLFVPKKLFIVGQMNMVGAYSFFNSLVKAGTEIHFMPAEGFAAPHEYVNMYPKSYDYSAVYRIYFWGKDPMDWFQQNRGGDFHPGQQIQFGFIRPIINQMYLKLDRKRRKIGFATRFVALNNIERLHMFYFLMESPAERDMNVERARLEIDLCHLYGKLFDEIIAKTDYVISLRPHPNEEPVNYARLKRRYGDRIEINTSNDVGEWLSECKLVVGQASSSFMDAHPMGIPVVCVDKLLGMMEKTAVFDPGLLPVYGITHLPETYEKLVSLIMSDRLEPKQDAAYDDMYARNLTGNSGPQFKRLIRELTANQPKASPLSWARDLAYLGALYLADAMLLARDLWRNSKNLNFDYSYFRTEISPALEQVSKLVVEASGAGTSGVVATQDYSDRRL